MKDKLKILIVDDHKIFRKSLEMTIKRLFPESNIQEVENGLEFLEIINQSIFDIVLMDIKMPVMNGIIATKKAMDQFPKLKILGISMTYEKIWDMKKAGSAGFIRKGGDLDEMKTAIDTILDGKKYFTEIQ